MGTRKLSRRAALRGAGGVALALPWLEMFGSTPAHAAPTKPKRFMVLFHHQGTILREWAVPGASEKDYQLGQILQPLEALDSNGNAWKERCLFLYGVDNKIAALNQSNGHNSSSRSCLTANVYSTSLDSSGNLIPKGQQPDTVGHSAGPSIDQLLASRLQTSHPYRSIDLSASRASDRLLYVGKDDPVTTEADPQKVFDKLFADGLQGAQELQKLRKRRLSVLDGVKENFDALRKRLGKDDRERLDAHADKISDLQLAITNAKECTVPQLAPMSGYDYQVHEGESTRLQLDLLTMAMACDLAPVGNLVFANSNSTSFDWVPNFPSMANYNNWHDMVHTGRNLGPNGDSDDPALIRGYQWYTEQFVELLSRLDATPEDDGTLLDNTLILWASEFGNGSGHNTRKLHLVLAGNTGGAAGMGRCLELGTGGDYTESPTSHNQVFVSILNAFGFDDTEFGYYTGSVAQGPVSGLL